MESKKSFILYNDALDVLSELTDEQAGKLFRAVVAYTRGEDFKLEPIERVAFIPIKNSIDRDCEKWQTIRDRNIENGKKGGRPTNNKNPKKPKKPTGLSGNPKNPVSVNVSVNDTVIKKDISNDIGVKTPVKYGNEFVGFVIETFTKVWGYAPSSGHGQTDRQQAHNLIQKLMSYYKQQGYDSETIKVKLPILIEKYFAKAHSEKWASELVRIRPLTDNLNKFIYKKKNGKA